MRLEYFRNVAGGGFAAPALLPLLLAVSRSFMVEVSSRVMRTSFLACRISTVV